MTKIARKLNHNSVATRLEQIYRDRRIHEIDTSCFLAYTYFALLFLPSTVQG
jgi:hypothetical protein